MSPIPEMANDEPEGSTMGNRRDHRFDNSQIEAPPGLEFLYAAYAVSSEPLEIGQLATGRRLIVPFEPGGRIEGPRMHGHLLPGSMRTHLVRSDGIVEVEGHVFLEMDDGHHIFVRTVGLLSISADTAQRLAEGQFYDPALLYARSVARFEAAEDGPYAWLNRNLYISRAERTAHAGRFTVWQIV